MKKLSALLLACALVLGLTACSGNNGGSADTVGGAYKNAFEATSATSAEAVVDELVKVDAAGTELVPMPMVEGYLDGFTQDITGFDACVKFSPMIGSIPFVGYVFETSDPEGLLKTLEGCADPAWNICTEADETVTAIKGNLVFFLMCSNEQ